MATQAEARREDERETGRLEAFSDGVFAIAVTLLVLDLHVPSADGDRALLSALGHEWPTYLAYLTSFLTILIMWLNHHAMFRIVRHTDHWLYLLNGLLLLMVSIVPFPTSLIATYLRHDGGRAAALVFAGTYLVLGIVFNALWRYIVAHPALHDPRLNPAWVQAISRRYNIGGSLYLVPILLAFVSVVASLAFGLALAVLFMLPLGVDHFLPEQTV